MEVKSDTKELYLECECRTHLLRVDADNYEYPGTTLSKDMEFSLAMFQYGSVINKGFWQRIKKAWGFLSKGTLYVDQLILNSSEAKKLADFLNDNLICK